MKKILLQSLSLISTLGIAQQKTNPNVIIIIADDLGFGDISAYGSKTINTPNIDNIANTGIRFDNGYATSATSTPSRYALFTGMYPWKNKDAKILPGDAPLLIPETQLTLPKIMKSAGYNTAAIGKWHLGMGNGNVNWNKPVRPGANDIGFDYSCIIAATNDRVPTVYVENCSVVDLDPNDPIYVSYENNFDGEPTALTNPELMKMKWSHGHNNSVINGIPRIGYMKGGEKARWKDEDMADYFVDKVKGYISDNSKSPFFLYYGLHQPHVPRTPHQRFVGSTSMGPRGDAIIEADWCVGEIMNHLNDLGILENTIIIFTSDNGPVLNDGYLDEAAENIGNHQPAGGLRGGKYSLFDGGTHVPFLLSWKGNVKPSVSKALVSQLDFLASFASMVGYSLNDQKVDSQDLLQTFLGKKNKGRKNLILEAQGKLAMRDETWAFIPPYKGATHNITKNELGNLKSYGLYNLTKDKGQEENVAEKNVKKLNQIKSDFFEITKGFYKEDVKVEPLK